MVEIERTALPGIGLRHTITTERGRQVGVVSHRTGRRDLVIYDREDPDTCTESVVLNGEEAEALAELFAAHRIVERLAELESQIQGLITEQIPIASGSPYEDMTLGDTRARTRTGASIVAVVREGDVYASPRPDFRFRRGDVVVAVGTGEGTSGVAEILANG